MNCGTAAAADTKFCKSCGKPVGSGAPAVAPDLAPTAVMTAPVRDVAPPPPPSAAAPPIAEPARAAQPPAPRVQPAPSPKLVAKPDPGRPMSPTQAPSGSKTALIVASVVVVALAAAGLVYKFVLHKPAAPSAQVVETPATSPLPPPPAAAEANPGSGTGNPGTQPAAGTDAQQPADATVSDSTPEGKSSPSGGSTPVPARVPKRSPGKPSGSGYAQAHANAEQALAASEYINPPDASALFWARKAKALGDPAAAQIEQQVYTKLMADVSAARQNHLYDQAQAQLYQLASSFPEHTELRQLQDDIHQEQQHYSQQQEEQRRQSELQAQTKKFAVQHRHGTGGTFCTGLITVTPDGIAKYDCNTADSGGRCEHVVFATGSLKEVKVRGDGSLHVATRQQGNFDFIGGEFALKDAASTLGALVKR